MLFVDYSSAFNTIVPATLVAKLQTQDWKISVQLDPGLSWQAEVRWSEWQQQSSPWWSSNHWCTSQGCVLSPLMLLPVHTRTDTAATTAPMSSSNLPTTQRWYAWSPTTMRRPTERRWVPWLNGVRRTTSHSTSTRPRSWWWISGDRAEYTHPSPSTRHLWSGWAALSSSAFTSPRISHGLLTQMQCWRRHISISSSWDGWGSLEWAPESSGPSTHALWRASWPAAHHRLVWKQHRWQPQSSAKGRANCPPHCWSELPSLQDIYTRRCTRKDQRIIKDSSHPSHSLLLSAALKDVSVASDHALADWGIAFPLRLLG